MRRPSPAYVGLLVGTSALLLAALFGCRSVDPSSSRTAPDAVTVLWSGAVTDTSARVTARVPNASARVQLAVTRTTWADTTLHAPSGVSPDGGRQFSLTNLRPRTAYQYALHINGRLDTTRSGRFRTFADGPFSFRVALGACTETGSSHPVFDAIRRLRPDLFLHLGDMHYEDITTPAPARFRTAYHRVHGSPAQAALFRSTPMAYMWDDHDYGPNNSSRRAPAQDPAQSVYRAYVPHYPLAQDQRPTRPIYQAFTVGRVRFLLTDLRSARTPNGAPDSVRTMMGAAQKQWFKRELRHARDRYPVIAWVSTVPWIGSPSDSEDHWGGFPDERRELATYIDSLGVADQLVVLSGDAHMVALDDGTHNHYGRDDGGGFPVVHAAALDQTGSVKGGPYTHGPYRTPLSLFGRRAGQFVRMDVQDDGDDVCITWTGHRYAPGAQKLTTLLTWDKCFPPP